MNVRIENQNLRFKISEEELKKLLDGHPVHAKIDFLDKTLVASINPAGRGEFMEPRLVLERSEAYLNLLVSQAHLAELSNMGRSRQGLEETTGDIPVSLQVDLRQDSRKSLKKAG